MYQITQDNQKKPKRIIRLSEVMKRTGKSRSSIYVGMAEGSFPKKIKTGGKSIGFLENEIEEWIENCVKASRPEDL